MSSDSWANTLILSQKIFYDRLTATELVLRVDAEPLRKRGHVDLFTFLSGLVFLLVVWLIFPRSSFAIAVGIILRKSGFQILGTNVSGWEDSASWFVLVAVVVGLFLDLVEHSHAIKKEGAN